jgi:hypothetical protein
MCSFKKILFLFFVFSSFVYGQNLDPRITISNTEINLQDDQIIFSVTVNENEKYEVGEFPDLKGFKKGNRNIKHGTVLVKNKKVSSHQINQVYIPEFSGKITIPRFSIKVNNKETFFEGAIVTVLGETEKLVENLKNVDAVDLILNISKKEIYVGEGLSVRLGLYIAENTTQLQFPDDISEQIEVISKKIKPKDCLESRQLITNIVGEQVVIDNKPFNFYKLFEAIYYPLNEQELIFPELSFKMINEKGNVNTDLVLKTKKSMVDVKELPNHPLKDKVPVGVLSFKETVDNQKQYTGNSISYTLKIIGDANFNTINIGKIENIAQFDFFPKNSKIRQDFGKKAGFKEYNFKIVPKESGEFSLSNYFYLIYFNTDLEKYDTLRSEKILNISGESLKDNIIENKNIYFGLENIKTDEKSFSFKKNAKVLANFVVILMTMVFLYIIKTKNKVE